jgi:CBS domain-containing protein
MNPNVPVQIIITTEMVTVRPYEPLQSIRKVFSDNSFHHLPVTGTNGELQGIISREDFYKVAYVMALGANGKPDENANRFDHLCAADIMTKYPLHLDVDDTVGLAADIFLANKFHALPIVEEGRLVGIITSHDLLEFGFNSPVEEDSSLAEYNEE